MVREKQVTEVSWNVVLQIVIGGGIVWILKVVIAINGSVGKLNTWREEHEKADRLTREDAKVDRRDIWSAINKLGK